MSRILLTGSEGLLGTEIKKQLKDEDVLNFDILIDPTQNIKSINKLPEDIEGIIHLAAISRVINAEKNPKECIDTNFWGTLNLLELARNHVDKPWFIYASSREVFGKSKILPVKEDWPKIPVQIYGVVKLACEHLCRIYSDRYKMKIRVVRFSNAYTNKYDQFDRVVPRFILRALKNLPLEINGTGEETFDFTHSEDSGLALKLVIDEIRRSDNRFDDFNLLAGQGTTLTELARKVIKLTNSKSKIIYRPGRDYDVDKFYGDYEKANKLLGYQPKHSLEEGLKKAIKELKEL